MIEALLVVGLSFFNPQVPSDSLGIETVDGKIFVIHRVEEKETLYSISRRYGATLDEVLKYNPSADAGLAIGQILRIPYTARTPVRTSPKGNVHVVAEKETLFSISRQYGVTVSELKAWNNLTSDNLSMGQELVIRKTTSAPATPSVRKGMHTVEAKETLYSIAKQYNITVEEVRKWNNLTSDNLSTGQILFVAPPVNAASTTTSSPVITAQTTAKPDSVKTQPPVVTQTIRITEGPANSDEISESGLAELIEGTEGNRKYLALHRTAPVGTILKVRNEMNNREVFVRVMGKLPDTALTDKLIIKVSKSAYDRLGAIDPRFRVVVTYYK
jgi:LysM repeat protein